ncbi:hypothetical protein [Parasitella parasitica]|uniref:Uncharacterized protein n=1 Tax=Parasitella parasitica TaxID=35722 RepID=A0A0B7NX19_9FUNG|nr:hypothetical protein [Parasitella parasitica]
MVPGTVVMVLGTVVKVPGTVVMVLGTVVMVLGTVVMVLVFSMAIELLGEKLKGFVPRLRSVKKLSILKSQSCLAENDIVIGTSIKTETTNGADITKLTGQFKKIKSMKQLTTAFNAIHSYQPKDIHEKIVQKIYLYIYIFEQYLGRKQNVMLRCRGDTISESCKKTGKKFKLDLRLVLTPEEDTDLDNCTGEVSKRATVKKIYKDKLKSTIATKCHLNSFVRAVPHIQVRELPSVKMPILQAVSFSFPQSLKQIRDGAIESLIDSLAAIEEMVDDLRKVYHDYTSSTTNDISSILSQTSRQSKPTHLNSWLTKVVFEKEDDDSSSSDENDDEEEEEDQ